MPVRPDPHRLLYFPAVPLNPAGQAPDERLTRQNLQELYCGVRQGDQHPIVLNERSKALESRWDAANKQWRWAIPTLQAVPDVAPAIRTDKPIPATQRPPDANTGQLAATAAAKSAVKPPDACGGCTGTRGLGCREIEFPLDGAKRATLR
jgi:hypothetical protein